MVYEYPLIVGSTDNHFVVYGLRQHLLKEKVIFHSNIVGPKEKGRKWPIFTFSFFNTFGYLDLIYVTWQNSKNIDETDFLKNAFEEILKSCSDRKSPRKKALSLYGAFWIGKLSLYW